MKWILRVLVVLAAFVLFAAGALFIAGMRPGANNMTIRIEVNRPREATWKFFQDPSRTKQWVSWLVEIRDLTPGNHGVGAKEIWVMEDQNNGGQRMEVANEVTALDPTRRIDFRLSARDEFEGTAAYIFEDSGPGRTIVTSTGQYHFASPLANFFAPVVLRFAEKKMATDLEHFKSLIEKE